MLGRFSEEGVFSEKEFTTKVQCEAEAQTRVPQEKQHPLGESDNQEKAKKRENKAVRVIVDRIRKTRDFKDVFKNGEKIKGKMFSLYVLKNAGTGPAATGITVAKKYIPKAVKRNYIRRVANSFFRENINTSQKGLKIVARMIRDVEGVGKRTLSLTLRKDLYGLLEKAGIAR